MGSAEDSTEDSIDEETEVELYAEPGSTWWPVLWGPVFAVCSGLLEAATGMHHPMLWALVGLGLAVLAVAWVSARRKALRVRLTTRSLHQGRERLAVARIDAVEDVGASMGAKILGGGWTVPKRFTGVPLQLDDGSRVLAWAKDGAALRTALSRLVPAPSSSAELDAEDGG